MRLRKRSELAVWILSLLLGFAGTCLYAGHAGIGTGTDTDTGIAGAAETGAEAYAPLRGLLSARGHGGRGTGAGRDAGGVWRFKPGEPGRDVRRGWRRGQPGENPF